MEVKRENIKLADTLEEENLYDSASAVFKKTALLRLKFWININSKASHSSEAFWNRSTDHRVIGIIAINATFNQIPLELAVSPVKRDIVSYEVLRRLCRCTDKTMRTIVQEGVERKDVIKIKLGRETFIKATTKFVKVFEEFEQDWIKLLKQSEE